MPLDLERKILSEDVVEANFLQVKPAGLNAKLKSCFAAELIIDPSLDYDVRRRYIFHQSQGEAATRLAGTVTF
jgi:hypothetical protein